MDKAQRNSLHQWLITISQKLTIRVYPEPDESNPPSTILFLYNVIFQYPVALYRSDLGVFVLSKCNLSLFFLCIPLLDTTCLCWPNWPSSGVQVVVVKETTTAGGKKNCITVSIRILNHNNLYTWRWSIRLKHVVSNIGIQRKSNEQRCTQMAQKLSEIPFL
jgi:hypothetical protein